ncbi:MAG: pyridoxamine 5'-phosphate oxidase family protein [Nitrososphaerales archaeon]
MVKVIGSSLPPRLLQKIKREIKNPRTNEVLLICSIDDHGFPKIALLSFLDIAIVSSKILLFAIGRASSTRRNLESRAQATLMLWEGDQRKGIVYVNGNCKMEKEKLFNGVEGFETSCFSFKVASVAEDYSKDAEILTTLIYETTNVSRSHSGLAKELNDLAKKFRQNKFRH